MKIPTEAKKAIILMSKYPRENHVKTRLAVKIGAKNATDFYRICLTGILNEACLLDASIDIFLYFSDESDRHNFQKMVPMRIKMKPQIEDTLPKRIDRAFLEVFNAGYDQVTIFSTDVPELKSSDIQLAVTALSSHDVCLGPNVDDGYYALGMNSYSQVLLDVEYQKGEGMYEQTFRKAKAAGLSLKKLATIADVDTINDLLDFKANNVVDWDGKYAVLEPLPQ